MGPTADEIARLDAMDEEEQDNPELSAQRAEIEQTRQEMSGTIAEIAERLNPQALMEQAKQTAHEVTADVAQQTKDKVAELAHEAHDATIGRAQEAFGRVQEVVSEKMGGAVTVARKASYTTMDYIRENPIPIALIGFGLGWLYLSSRRQDGADPRSAHNPYYYQGGDEYQPGYAGEGAAGGSGGVRQTLQETRERVGEAAGQARERVGEVAGQAREKVGDMAGQAREKVGEVAGQAREAVTGAAGQLRDRAGQVVEQVQGRVGELKGQVQERAGELSGRVQERVGDVRQQVQEQAGRAGDVFQNSLQDNPLIVGAVAMGIGAAVALMMPVTERENQLMGQTRDRLVGQVGQQAQQVVQKVQTVAQETITAVKEEAQNQGLVQKVQEVVRETVDTAKNEAKAQGLLPGGNSGPSSEYTDDEEETAHAGTSWRNA